MSTRAAPTEDAEQTALFQRVAYSLATLPELALLFHIPNGGYRSRRTAARFKEQGVKAGIPDLLLPVARHGFHGLWIEMKRTDSRPSETKPLQLKWHTDLTAQGYRVEVCKGWESAWNVLMNYLSTEGKTNV